MKLKKSIISIICSTLLVTTFTGCGDTEETIIAEPEKIVKEIKKKEDTPKQKIEKDLKKIISGVDKYYDIVGQFPTTGSFNNNSINWGTGYVSSSIAKKWLIEKFKNKIVIKPKIEEYKKVTEQEIGDIYNNCMIGSSIDIGCILLLDKYDSPFSNMVINKEKKQFKEDLDEVIYGVKKYYDIVGTYPETDAFKIDNKIWSGTYIPPVLVNRWNITKYSNRVTVNPNNGIYTIIKEEDMRLIYIELCNFYYDDNNKNYCPLLIRKEISIVTEEDLEFFNEPELQLRQEIKVMLKGIKEYYKRYNKYPDYINSDKEFIKNNTYDWNREDIYIPNKTFINWVIEKHNDELTIKLKKNAFPNLSVDMKKTIFKQKCIRLEQTSRNVKDFNCVVLSTKKIEQEELLELVTKNEQEKIFLKEMKILIKGITDYRDIYKKFPPTGSLNMSDSKINKTDLLNKDIAKKWWLGSFFGNMVELEPKEDFYTRVAQEFKTKVYYRYCDNEKNVKVCVLKK